MSRSAAAQSIVHDSPLTSPNLVEFDYTSIEEAFPTIDAGLIPCGAAGLFQVKNPKRRTKGGIILSTETVSADHYNTQVAKVIALGPMCFKSVLKTKDEYGNDTGEDLQDWPEGPWYKIGGFVRIPRYSGDRFTVPFQRREMQTNPENGRPEAVTVKDEAIFVLLKAAQVLGVITGDPTKVRAYLD